MRQQDVAQALTDLGHPVSQGWVSRVETGKTAPTSQEAVLMAALVGADPVVGMKVAGHLDEPPLMRIDGKIDTILRLVRAG